MHRTTRSAAICLAATVGLTALVLAGCTGNSGPQEAPADAGKPAVTAPGGGTSDSGKSNVGTAPKPSVNP